MSVLLVSRSLKNGEVAFASFLVDIYCLGIKDVSFNIVSRNSYDRNIHGKLLQSGEAVELEPSAARKLIEGAVDYARQFDLAPHRDYSKARRIFGDVDAADCAEEFAYGKNGKPYFVAGPNDNPSRCARIISQLTNRVGPDGFHYFMPMSDLAMAPENARVLAIDDDGDLHELTD